MNTRITFYIFVVIMFVMVVAVVGCKGPEGPQGPPGETTLVNLEGFAPGIKCGTCHIPDTDTTYYLLARAYQWSTSKHAVGGDLERNGSTCAGCHTSEGFVQRMKNLAGGSTSQVVSNQVQPSPPGCFACHSPHLRANFTLRDTTPVTIKSFVTGVPDAVFDYGKGNLCVKCHQTRTTSTLSPLPDPTKTAATDTISITSSRWYPHYGVQGQMFLGTGGFQFAGYTYTGNSYHSTATAIKQKGCVICHMAEPVYSASSGAGKGGGHTMNIRYTWEGTAGSVVVGCKVSGCHPSSMTTPDIAGASTGGVPVQTLVHAYLDTLEQLMTDKTGVLTGGRYKREWLVPGTEGYSINASSSKPLKISPASRAGALWNYLFVEHDRSEGVHNTKYTLELLKSSIAELRK